MTQLQDWTDWATWALAERMPSRGLRLLRESGGLEKHPELAAIVDVPQDPIWHPEGDVWIHTLHVCDVAAEIAAREQLDDEQRLVLIFSALCHDLGKATTTELIDGRWRARGHCVAGVAPSERFLQRIGCPESVIACVKPLVAEHLVHAVSSMGLALVRRLITRLVPATLQQLVRLIEADVNGRPPLPWRIPTTLARLIEFSGRDDLQAYETRPVLPAPLIRGRHLVALGHTPAAWFGLVLRRCHESQLAGLFTDESSGLEYLARILSEFGGETTDQKPVN